VGRDSFDDIVADGNGFEVSFDQFDQGWVAEDDGFADRLGRGGDFSRSREVHFTDDPDGG